MSRTALRATTAAAATATLLALAPALAQAAPSADARGLDETTAEVTFHNDTGATITCGALVHFFGLPLSWFGWPPAVTVPPMGSASQQMPFITPGVHSVRWGCQGPGGGHAGYLPAVAVGGAANSVVNLLPR